MPSTLDSMIFSRGVKMLSIFDSMISESGCAAPSSWPFAYNTKKYK